MTAGKKAYRRYLCILTEREHHPEIRRVFLCLDGDGTGVFLATYQMTVMPVEGHRAETQEVIVQVMLACREWRRNMARVEFARISEDVSPYTMMSWFLYQFGVDKPQGNTRIIAQLMLHIVHKLGKVVFVAPCWGCQ